MNEHEPNVKPKARELQLLVEPLGLADPRKDPSLQASPAHRDPAALSAQVQQVIHISIHVKKTSYKPRHLVLYQLLSPYYCTQDQSSGKIHR